MTGDRIETPVGRFSVFNVETRKLMYKNEYDLRDGLAALAWMNGWEAAIEVAAAARTRADLVLTAPAGRTYVAEIKVSVRTPSEARKAFQQADGYRRHFAPRNMIHGCRTFVLGAEVDLAATAEIKALYPGIQLATVSEFMSIIRGEIWADETQPSDRERVAAARLRGIDALATYTRAERLAPAIRRRETFLHKLALNYPAASLMLMREIDKGERAARAAA